MSEEKREERCQTCRFWSGEKNKDEGAIRKEEEAENMECASGFCHRYPPILGVPVSDDDQQFRSGFSFPGTFYSDWCGEWRAVNKADPLTSGCPPELTDAPISKLGLPPRAQQILEKEVATIGQLVQWEERDLLDIRYFGPMSVDFVRAALAKLGLKLLGD